jgi:hypothetical protein
MDVRPRPRAAGRRARGAVLATLVSLAALNAGLALRVNARPDLRDPLYFPKEDLLAAQYARPVPGRVTVVALGSSRTANAFHPPTVEAEVTAATGRPCLAFNLAMPGSGPLTELLHLRRLLARGVRPDLVVVEVTPVMCAVPETFFLRPERVSRAELEALAGVGFADERYRAEWWEATVNPWSGLRFQLLAAVRPKWTPPGVPRVVRGGADPRGWNPWREVITPEVYAARLAVARREHFATLQHLEAVGEVPRRALLAIFATCRREGITAVAVLPPEGSDFRAWYGPGARRVAGELRSMANAATGGRAVDAGEWLPDDAFVDGHHVQEWAAPGYTERLAREVLAPALRDASGRPTPVREVAGRSPGRGDERP